jgi:hypothetical protein
MTAVARNGYWRECYRPRNVAAAAFGDEVRMRRTFALPRGLTFFLENPEKA